MRSTFFVRVCFLFLTMIISSCSSNSDSNSGGQSPSSTTADPIVWKNYTPFMLRTYGLAADITSRPSFQYNGNRIHVFYKCYLTSNTSILGTCSVDDLYSQTFNDYLGALMPSIVSPTPNLDVGGQPWGYIRVNAPLGWTSVASSAMSESIPRSDVSGAHTIAQFLYNPSNASEAPKLVVLEGLAPQIRYWYQAGTATQNETTWTTEWNMLGGGNIGTFASGAATYRQRQLDLVSGTVTALVGQNSDKPYLVSAIGNLAEHQMFFYNVSSTWTAINLSGFNSDANNIIGFRIGISNSGELYGCNVTQVNTPTVHYEGQITKYNGTSWTNIYTQSNAYNTSVANYNPCRLVATESGGMYAAFQMSDGTLDLISISGSAATPVSTVYSNKIDTIWDMKASGNTIYLAIQKLYVPDADGTSNYTGPSNILLKFDGSQFSQILEVTGYPYPFIADYSPNFIGININPDFSGLDALVSNSLYPDGSFTNSKQYVSIWQAR